MRWSVEIREGDIIGPNKKPLVETLELWRRDPVECIPRLDRESAFREYISYAPEEVYLERQGYMIRCGVANGGGKFRP